MAITANSNIAKNGSNHYAIMKREPNAITIGKIIFDPIRNQFSFHPDSPDYNPSVGDSAAILALLNSMVK